MNRVAAIILALCLVASLIEAKPHFLSKKSRGRGIGGNEPGGKMGGPGTNSPEPGPNNHESGSKSHERHGSDESQSPLDEVLEIVQDCLTDDAVRPFDDCMNNAFDGEPEEVREIVQDCLEVSSLDWRYNSHSSWDFDLNLYNLILNGWTSYGWESVYDDAVRSFDDCMNNAFDGEPATDSSKELSRDVDDERDTGSGSGQQLPVNLFVSAETSKEADMKKEAAYNAARAQKAKKMMAKKSSIMKALAQKRAMAKVLKKKHAA